MVDVLIEKVATPASLRPTKRRVFTKMGANSKPKRRSDLDSTRPLTKGGSFSKSGLGSGPVTRSSMCSQDAKSTAARGKDNIAESISRLLRQAVFDCAAQDRERTEEALAKHTRRYDRQSGEETPAARSTSPGRPDEAPDVDSHSIPAWKRVFDLAVVVLASPVWLPLMLLLMLVVRLSSPGPIFYRQDRVGYRGRRFLIWKFRTMKIDADTYTHESYFEKLVRDGLPMTKLDVGGDPRIIPCGRLLRASGLDELPQIFNIMRGAMSVVGPRPCTVREFDAYLPWQQARVNALPGLTGYWQVNGKNRTTFNEMIKMDIFYAEHLSLRLDLRIISKTFSVLLDQTLTVLKRVPAEAATPASVENPDGVRHEQGARV